MTGEADWRSLPLADLWRSTDRGSSEEARAKMRARRITIWLAVRCLGMKYKEIATIVGISHQRVRQIIAETDRRIETSTLREIRRRSWSIRNRKMSPFGRDAPVRDLTEDDVKILKNLKKEGDDE